MNTQGTDGGSVTVGLPDFASEALRRALIAKRLQFGADTPAGHRCSNLVEINDNLRGATDEQRRHLLANMARQTAELEALTKLFLPATPRKNINLLTLERLREVLNYDPETGALTWRLRLSPNCKLGEPAGQIGVHGYRKIRIDGVYHTASHLAWFHHHGVAPDRYVDHKNGDKQDNRIENLRLATPSQNCMNQRRNARNTTGFKGVSVNNAPYTTAKFRSSIRHNGKRIFLGLFHTAEEAHEAYCKAAAELHGEFARTH